MRQDDLMMNFERLRKQGRGERWKTGKQRQKQPKKQAILAISELKDAKLLEDYVTASSMDPDLYRATIQGDILEFIKAVEQGPDNRHAGVPAASCIQVTPQKNTVLHLATIFGHDEIVKLISKDLPFLGLSTTYAHPKVVNYLTWDKRVDVNLVNNEGQTAFDIAVSVEHPTSLHQRLIWTALKSTGARRAGNSKVPPKLPKSPNTDQYKDRVNTLLLVSTLVATVTFAAGFTMPGGYNSSDPSAGMAIFLMRNMFHMFVICNTIAMYTSILAAIIFIWAQLRDLNLMDTAFRFALPLLGLALYAMSFGFMAGVSLVVSNLHWLAIVVFIIGIICLFSLSVPFLLLFLPSKSTNRILRYISYYPFLILVWASESPEIKQED
ncbi:unnamed protein product, partial [Vitis vinifera]